MADNIETAPNRGGLYKQTDDKTVLIERTRAAGTAPKNAKKKAAKTTGDSNA